MDELLYFYVTFVSLAIALATICIWSPRTVRVKILALFVAALFIPTAYASMSGLLSRPKPVSLEWVKREAREATVLAVNLREGEAIYLWLQIPDTIEPLAYILPWRDGMAKQLMQASREAEQKGQKVKMRNPFEKSLDRSDRKFYAEPQKRLPQKPVPRQNPSVF